MSISRRRLTVLGAAFLGSTSIGFPAFPEGSPPSDSQGTPKTKTKTGGATTTRKKPVKCCIDSRKISALKREIRKMGAIHNNISRNYRRLQSQSSAARTQLRDARLKVSGVPARTDRLIDTLHREMVKIENGKNPATRSIDRAQQDLLDANEFCDQANKSKDCNARKRGMRRAISKLISARTKLETGIFQINKTMRGFSALPKPYVKHTPRAVQFAKRTSQEGPYFKGDNAKLNKLAWSLDHFEDAMLDDC